jgi:hypothetical protein
MTFIIRKADNTIKTFTARGDDVSLGEGETFEESPLTFVEYAGRLRLSLGGSSGETLTVPFGAPDQVVTVTCPGEASVTLLVNGVSEAVPLINGTGTVTLSAEVAGRYLLTPADTTKYCPAGESVLIIEVN